VAKRLKAPYFDAYFRAGLRGRGLPVRFGVVTAYNPLGKRGTAAANRRRDAALRRHLDKMRLKRFRVIGGSKDGSHREPGWGVIAPRETIRALSSLFEQDAYFWVSSGKVLLGSSTGGKLKPAGTWKARQARW
jgi:hypothetical protein